MDNRELAESLCAVSPVLSEARRAHVAAFGTLVPHVFMGEVLARVGSCMGASRAAASGAGGLEVRCILSGLEEGMASGDRETRNVIAISFASPVEVESFFGALAPLLGPRIRALLPGL